MKKILRDLYKIKIINIVCVIAICVLTSFVFDISKYIFSNIFDAHIGLNFEIDFLTVYSGFLTLILPVAILIIERIENKDNAIISETYLRGTGLFPIVVYFVVNMLIIAFNKNQYYFIMSCIFSIFIIIYMYYKSFRMISNLIYEKEKINKINEEIVSNDLVDQTMYFSDDNKITGYQKYGIYVGRYNYISTDGYEKKNLYPKNNYLLIKQYNYRTIKKLIKKLQNYNKQYIETFSLKNEKNEYNSEVKPNAMILLSDIGSTLNKNSSWITIYYKKNFEQEMKSIVSIIEDKLYIATENNNHLYIELANQNILRNCIESINMNSSSLLSENLDKYLELYKNYINEISSKLGTFTYEESYGQVNSFVRFRGMDFLINMQKNIYDYAHIILEKNNARLMNSLISFLYNMLLYSYQKKELLSIQLLYSTYIYLLDCSLDLDENSSFEKIKLEIFEFVNMLKYDISNSNSNFEKDSLLVCNRTIGNIVYKLSDKDENKCIKYYKKTFDFINDIKEDLDSIKINSSKSLYHNKLLDIYENYTSNMFAISAYIFQKKKSINFSLIMNFYNDIDSNTLTKILMKCIYFDYNDHSYSWDMLDIEDFDDNCFHNVNTTDYLIQLYCLIISKINIKSIYIESTYELSNYYDRIISELKKINKEEYINIFEQVKKDIEEEEKKYIRNTPISLDKANQFKSKFLEYYYKNNRLLNLFKITNNYKNCKRRKKGINYLGIKNIVNKTYFLNETPNNRCIIWNNFEDHYANSFINSEEDKYVSLMEKKSIISEDSILNYLKHLNLNKLKKSILFTDYDSLYKFFELNMFSYTKVENKEYANLYLKIKNISIPIVIINGLEDNCIYHVFENKLGKIEKSEKEFKFEIIDFYKNDELLKKCMTETINGLELIGEERKNHLLESVDLFIQEYIYINDENLEVIKFSK